jgi:hypothetical protein
MKHRLLYAFGMMVIGSLGVVAMPAAADSPGPYYASPSWDQTLPASTRFIVLSNFNSEAVLDRETGLVWEKTPSTDQMTISRAQFACSSRQTGGRMGWRLPKMDELFSLLDPTQINNKIGSPAALPLGNPFVGAGGNPRFWTTDQDAPPFNNNVNLIFVFVNAGIFNTTDYNDSAIRAWCVRGPGGATISP